MTMTGPEVLNALCPVFVLYQILRMNKFQKERLIMKRHLCSSTLRFFAFRNWICFFALVILAVFYRVGTAEAASSAVKLYYNTYSGDLTQPSSYPSRYQISA